MSVPPKIPAADAPATGPSATGASAAGAPPNRYTMGSWPNLVRSLLVVLGLVAVLVFLVPRVSSLSGPPVDVHATGLQVKEQTGWPIVEARGLPKGWTATAARFIRGTDGKMTWLAGYQTPAGEYASVEQTADSSAAWIEAQTNRARATGDREIAGRTWKSFERGAKVQNSLLHVPADRGELTTLVTGTAPFADLAVLIEHLVPVS